MLIPIEHPSYHWRNDIFLKKMLEIHYDLKETKSQGINTLYVYKQLLYNKPCSLCLFLIIGSQLL